FSREVGGHFHCASRIAIWKTQAKLIPRNLWLRIEYVFNVPTPERTHHVSISSSALWLPLQGRLHIEPLHTSHAPGIPARLGTKDFANTKNKVGAIRQNVPISQ